MRLSYITFIFENCDHITIDGKYIGDFLVEDIRTSVQRIACNSIERMDTAHTFAIEICKDANKERYHHNQTQIEEWKQMTFDRFMACDITSIEFELKNDVDCYTEHYNYYVDWASDHEYHNDSQVNYVSEDGHLYITIAVNKSTEDFFDLEEINDKSYSKYMNNFYWNMSD